MLNIFHATVKHTPTINSKFLHYIYISLLLHVSATEYGNLYGATNFINIYSILLTYSTVQSPSCEANRFAASQEIPRISRNPKVHYRTHKRPPTFSILGQPKPVHIPTSHLLEIHPNIIHPSTPRSPLWSPSLRFPHQDPIPRPTHYLHTFLLHGAESF